MVKTLVARVGEKVEVMDLDYDGLVAVIGGTLCNAPNIYTNYQGDDYTIYVHDEGILQNMPMNRGYAGTIAIQGYDSATGDEADLSEELIADFTKAMNVYKHVNTEFEDFNNLVNQYELENRLFRYSPLPEGSTFVFETVISTYDILGIIGNQMNEADQDYAITALMHIHKQGYIEQVFNFIESIGSEVARHQAEAFLKHNS